MISPHTRPRVAFFGTPDVAVPTLDRLVGIADVALVVTQPDRPVGRSGKPHPPPVKVRASELGVAVAQPARSTETAVILREHGPFDAAVLVAFGQLIRPEALAAAGAGFLNVHFSVLPRWRGAAPVQRAIMAQDPRVGVTVMVLDEGLDTGPTVATLSTALGAHESGGDVLARLAGVGAKLLADVLGPYIDGRLTPTPQPENGTVAAKLTQDDRRIDWSAPAADCVARIRALAPRPGAVTVANGKPLKILWARALQGEAPPGSVDAEARVGTGEGLVRLVTVQPAGRRPMAAADWLRGLRVSPVFDSTDTA